MFLVNSRLGHFTAAPFSLQSCKRPPKEAPLIPKLRGNFAEFLNEGSPVRLGMLYPSTCVGLRYGRASLTRGFSRQLGFNSFRPFRLAVTPQLSGSFIPRLVAYKLGAGSSTRRPTYPSVSPLRSINLTRYRIINLLSIGYALRPRLRPD